MIRTKHRLKGWAVSPIHIGDGTKIDPSGFMLNGNRLDRFEPAQVISNLGEKKQLEYIKMLKQNGLKEAQDLLRKNAYKFILENIAVSQHSINDIQISFDNLKRLGELSPFIRTGGKPFIPATTIKGALRTAYLAKIADGNQKLRQDTINLANNDRVGNTSRTANTFQQSALEYKNNTIEKDPFRDLMVTDGKLSQNSTIYDKVQIAKLSGDGGVRFEQEKGIQIHVERLNSIFDNIPTAINPAEIEIEIALPEAQNIEKRQKLNAEKSPNTRLKIDILRSANNVHHAKLWFLELNSFYQGTGTDSLMNGFVSALGIKVNNADEFAKALNEKGAWLLKIGRFAHFEAKSIEGMRFGEKRGTKGNQPKFIKDHAGTRQLAKNQNNIPLPFGWVILFDENKCPATAPKITSNIVRTFENGAKSQSSSPALSSQYLFFKGEKLINDDGEIGISQENVSVNTKEFMIKIDGSDEKENPKNWKKI